METDKLDLENKQTEQNNFAIQEYNEEKRKRQQKEIEDMKKKTSKDKEPRIQELKDWLNKKPKIDQWVIDLFNHLKKEKDREEYLQKFVEDYLKNI